MTVSSPGDHEPEFPAEPGPDAGLPPRGCPPWFGEGEDVGDCLTPEEIAELSRQEWELIAPDPDDPAYDDDPLTGAPPEWPPLLVPGDEAPPPVPEVFDAGFTHGRGGDGSGFAAGGMLDVMLPGSQLARHLSQAVRPGLAAYGDDELFGLLGASVRQESWTAAVKHTIVAEIDRRRAASDGSPGEHVEQELAAALTLTGWSASALLGVTRDLARLPKTWVLLANGMIDSHRAAVIVRHTAVLSDAAAAAIEDLILPKAGSMTTSELSSLCRRAAIKADPQAARKRKDKALNDARVDTWLEPSGTGAIAGRDLPPAEVIAADKHIDAIARWLKTHGAHGTLAHLRAQAYLALLNGQPIHTLLPTPTTSDGDAATTSTGSTAPTDTDAGATQASTPAGSPAGQPVLGGTVNLTMPYDTWQGLTDTPGEIAGYGAADAGTCRDITTRLAATATRWCITLTDRNGKPAGHGCAKAGPGPPGTASNPATWLATITIHPIETSTCAHLNQSAGYQPSNLLRHIIKTRSPRCGFPGCRRPATRCDDDHTIPYHLGGRSCECNLYPLCRRHHRCKQAPGWHLDQPRPGELIWTAPSGRTYTKETEPYPV
jgi:Domain of unknown function (DUF222)